MFNIFLTQSGGLIIGNIAKLIGLLLNLIYEGLSSIGIVNLGLCIIILTLVVKLCMVPLTIKQQKFQKMNSIMQPEIAKINKKYKNKKDQESVAKQNQELQDLYAKYGVSPTGSCIQLLIQMPILLGLYRVVYNIPAYVGEIKNQYMHIVNSIISINGFEDKIAKLSKGISVQLDKVPTSNQMVDLLYKFKPDTWNELKDAFSAYPDVISKINTYYPKLQGMNDFIFGINIAETPGFRFSIYLIIPLLSAILTIIQTKTLNSRNMQSDDDNNPAMGMMKSMNMVMPVMTFVTCMMFPAGLGIYWTTSTLFQIIQQVIINFFMDRMDVDKFIEKNMEKAKKKKKSFMQRMMEAQLEQQEELQKSNGQIRNNTITSISNTNTKKINGPNSNQNIKKDSMAAKANIMLDKKYNEK